MKRSKFRILRIHVANIIINNDQFVFISKIAQCVIFFILTDSKEALIPLNVRVLSVGSDWAVMTWDPPTCSSLDEGQIMGPSRRRTKQRASPCATELFPLQYQLRYQVLDPSTIQTGEAVGELTKISIYYHTFIDVLEAHLDCT